MAQSYGGVPRGPLSAYLSVRDANQQADLRTLQGGGQIQGMLAGAQQQQEQQQELQQIKQVVAQAGGDPAKASEALI
mgnify:CR=1 FL=1